MDRTITVTGTGSAAGTPDTVELNLGVRVQANGAAAALRDASRRAGELASALGAAGVADRDIATTSVSVWPTYGGGEHPRIVGYEATNQLRVRFRQVAGAGQVIDAAASVVGDAITIDSLSFLIDDPTELESSARRAAMAAAHRNARELAAAAGAEVGQVRTIHEGRVGGGPSPMAEGRMMAMAAAVPLQPGSQQVTIQVQVSYELVDAGT